MLVATLDSSLQEWIVSTHGAHAPGGPPPRERYFHRNPLIAPFLGQASRGTGRFGYAAIIPQPAPGISVAAAQRCYLSTGAARFLVYNSRHRGLLPPKAQPIMRDGGRETTPRLAARFRRPGLRPERKASNSNPGSATARHDSEMRRPLPPSASAATRNPTESMDCTDQLADAATDGERLLQDAGALTPALFPRSPSPTPSWASFSTIGLHELTQAGPLRTPEPDEDELDMDDVVSVTLTQDML